MTLSPTRLTGLLEGAGIRPLTNIGANPAIHGAAIDSRGVKSGYVFFAARGLQKDGMDFVPQAIRSGAVAVVAESERPTWISPEVAWVRVESTRPAAGLLSRELYGRPDEALDLVGVTGTNGKTTVSYLVDAIGRAAGVESGRMGTVGHAFGGVERSTERTTPEAPEFFQTLADMRDAGTRLVVAEVSSHALALDRVHGAAFDVAAFLNLSRDHLDFHHDEQRYLQAKARLFDQVKADGHAVLPEESPFRASLARQTRATVITFGRSEGASVRLREEHCAIDGSSAVLETPRGRLPLRTFLLGRFNLDNIAAAAACALALDLPPESISAGVLAVDSLPGRVQRIDRGQPFAVVVDYAHTTDALKTLLTWMREVTNRRLLVVFGCGGERDRGKRPEMGAVAAKLADRVILTSDNPRGEDPRSILEAIHDGVKSVKSAEGRCTVIEDRREAIRAVVEEAEPGDVVVIAGKGHETTQSFGTRDEPFDDREVAAEALESLTPNGETRCPQ